MYTHIRLSASSVPNPGWQTLRSMGPIGEESTSLSKSRAYRIVALIFLFDFDVSNLIQWLDRVYTHTRIPLDPIRKAVVFL